MAQQRAKATQRILIGHARRPASEEDRPWVVEAAGDIFATPPLRSLSEKTAQRYYIAVPPEVEKKVLTEGYHPTKRSSVPVSATPAQALAAYLKVLRRSKEERAEVDKKRKENQSQSEDSLDDRLWDLWEWTSAHELFPVLSEDQRGVRAAVLSVQVPPEMMMDVVTHPQGGFLIRTKGQALPGSCFSRVKRSDAP